MLTDRQTETAKNELSKIMQMASEGIQIQMFSKAIDAVWHDLRLQMMRS